VRSTFEENRKVKPYIHSSIFTGVAYMNDEQFTLRCGKCARLMRQLLRQLCQACNPVACLQADEQHLASSMQIRRHGDIHSKI